MILYVLNQSFNVVGTIDEYVSLIWRPAYYDVGDFELYINATPELVALLKKDYLLVRACDVSVEDMVPTYTNVMIIKNLDLTTSAEDGDYYTVTGRELKYILHQRIVWNQTNLSGNCETAIRRLVVENAINPADNKRIIPNLILGALTGLTETIRKQVTYASLDEAVSSICESFGYGYEVVIIGDKMVFIVYAGADRSYNQTVRPYVVFSDDFDNIVSSEYQLISEHYANCTLVAGEGEGVDRVRTTVGDEKSGLDRYEYYTDAKDLSRNMDTEDEIPLPDYIDMLKERGREKLAELKYTEGFGGEVVPDLTFKYNEDFYIGDVVTIINKYGISRDVRVVSAIESDDETGTKLIPQFNI